MVTSPPYSFAIDYLKGDKSQLSFLGINTETLRERMIGLRGKNASDKVLQYFRDMDRVFAELHRVLKEGKYMVVVVDTNMSQLRKVSE
jgi:DNA modification methylase